MSQMSISSPSTLTESSEKIVQAMINLFPDAQLEIGERGVYGSFSDLSVLEQKINIQQIKDTARHVLDHACTQDQLVFHLNKQAAFASKVNFTDGNSVLGDITVKISGDNIQLVIEKLAPKKKED